jgi:hypothetical protein
MNWKLLWLIPFALLVGLVLKNWSWSVSEDDVVGTYVNTNYGHQPCCVEAPHEPDTLILRSDGTMRSGFYGEGTWEVKDHGTELHWSYPCEYGTDWEHQHVKAMCGYTAEIENEVGRPIRLTLEDDWRHCYERIH